MVQFIPKAKIISRNIDASVPQQLSTSTQETYVQGIKPNVIGIVSTIVYLLIFMYAYATAAKTGKITLNLKDHYGITLSEAMEHSERIGTTILIVIYSGLHIGLMIEKGFLFGNNPGKISIVATNFALLLGMLLLFLIPVSKKNKVQAGIHFLVAGFIIIFIVYSSFMITELYRSELEENEFTESMLGLSLVSLISAILIIGIIVCKFLFGGNYRKLYEILFTIVGILEIILILAFGVL